MPDYGNPDLIGRKLITEEGEAVYHDGSGRVVKNPQMYKLSSRTIVDRERDLHDIERLFLQGHSFVEITKRLIEKRRGDGEEEYTISREQVVLDCKEVMNRWRESYLSDADEYFNREMTRLDRLEATYWDAWEESKEKRRLVATQQVTYGDAPMNPNEVTREDMDELEGEEWDTNGRKRKKRKVPPRTTVTVQDVLEVGDVKFLQGIERVIEQRWKLLGFGQTRNVNINWRKQAESSGIDPEDLMGKLVEGFIKEGEKK